MTESPNVELVRSIYAAWERGDLSGSEWAHPEIEHVFADGPSPGSRIGLTGMAEGWRDMLSAWDDLRLNVDEYRELNDGRVLVLGLFSGRGKTSGIALGALSTQWANVVDVQDGRVRRIVFYWDRDRAFADLGLTPGGDTP